jgi:hypothetical protein
MVNRADAYLGVVLPASRDPHGALAKLGLPERCDAMVGASWYRQRGEKLADACPEVLKLSSVDFVKLARDEPDSLARAVARVLPATQELSPPYVGVLEGGDKVPVNELPWWLGSPLHAIAWRLPLTAYALMAVALAIATPLALLAAFAWARPSRTQHGAQILLAMLLGGVMLYALATTTFGDGLSESARHFLPGALAMYAACIALLFAIPALAMRWMAEPKQSALEIVAAVAGIAAVAVGCRFAMGWAAAQPLAIGVLDQPESRVLAPGETLRLRGWALDPHGVESVTVAVGKSSLPARYLLDNPAVKRFHPSYPDSDHAGFALDVSADDLAKAGAPEPLLLSIVAKSTAGPALEIDRRRLEFRAP